MDDLGWSRRSVLAGFVAAAGLTVSGCASPYGFGELDQVGETIAEDLTKNTPYSYSLDSDGKEDPGNEVNIEWNEGALFVSADAEYAESQFCRTEYPKKELQQDPERMAQEKQKAFDTLLEENPSLDDVYFYMFTNTMGGIEPRENTGYYSFRIDFDNGNIWNEYAKDEALEMYESITDSDNPMETASQQFRENARFECSGENLPKPPGTNRTRT